MATYDELNNFLELGETSGLRKRVIVASLVAADNIRLEPDDPNDAILQNRKRFSQSIFRQTFEQSLYFRPDDSALALNSIFEAIYRLVIIANKGATVAQITAASDSAIQTAVNDAIEHLAHQFADPTP